MATIWVSSSARGAADGTSYDDAYGSIADGLGDISAKGDIVNIVADGVHTWPTTRTDVSNIAGTSYTDYGCLIRGTDTSGNPAIATLAPASSGTHRVVRFTGTTKYTITENLVFDATSQHADVNEYTAVEWNGASQGPHKVRYCAMLGGASGNFAAGNRHLTEPATGSNNGDQGIVEYCYFQNINGNASPTTRQYRYDHCVYINDSGSQRTGVLFNFGTIVTDQADRLTQVTNCTIFDDTTSQTQDAVVLNPAANIDVGTADVYSNFYWADTIGTVNPFFGGNGSATGVTHTGTINANVLLGGPNVVSGDLAVEGWYELPWDANDDDATDPDYWPSDTVAYEQAAADVFNDPSSTYDWELPNGLTLTLLKDLRPIRYKTAGLFGSTPGALPVVSEDDPTDEDDAASVPFIDVRPFYAPVLRLEANIRLSTERNRSREQYLRTDVEDQSWREVTMRRFTLASGGTERLRSGIETGKYIMLESDEAVRLNASTVEDRYLPAAKQVVVLGGEYTILKVKNETASTAIPLIVMVD